MSIRTTAATAALAAAIVPATANAGEDRGGGDFHAAFARLKALQGTWHHDGGESYDVSYSVTGNGSALVEEFRDERGMASVYHMDGDELRVTHYCGAGNQPRMRATDYDAGTGRLRFDFVDVTNLSSPDAYHTRQLEVVFLEDDRLQLRFNGLEDGREMPVVIDLARR